MKGPVHVHVPTYFGSHLKSYNSSVCLTQCDIVIDSWILKYKIMVIKQSENLECVP